MKGRYYTPEIEEFHHGFRYEGRFANIGQNDKGYFVESYSKWESCTYQHSSFNIYTEQRVKHLDKSDIEEIGWEYTGKTTELWFGVPKIYIQPFNLVYRSLRLSYNITDHRLLIWGYEYENYSPENSEETLFLGKIKNYSELKRLMKQIGICRT